MRCTGESFKSFFVDCGFLLISGDVCAWIRLFLVEEIFDKPFKICFRQGCKFMGRATHEYHRTTSNSKDSTVFDAKTHWQNKPPKKKFEIYLPAENGIIMCSLIKD